MITLFAFIVGLFVGAAIAAAIIKAVDEIQEIRITKNEKITADPETDGETFNTPDDN